MEIYTKIKGFENYAISNFGNVLNIKTQKFLKSSKDGNGYLFVKLCKNEKRIMRKIHRLIAEHFIDNPNNYPCVDHIDRDRTNNSISNLRWTTSQINSRNMSKKNNCSSIYKGVCFYKKNNNWCSRIVNNYKRIHIGYYNTELEAAVAYNKYITDNQLEGFILNSV